MIIRGSTIRGVRVAAIAVPSSQVEFTTPGTYSWTAPAGVTSVSAVCIGGGGAGTRGISPSNVNQLRRGGGGAGLGWKNNISVTPGQTYTVVVGAGGTSAGPDPNFLATSITNNTIAISGSKTWTLNIASPFAVGDLVKVASATIGTYYMIGLVTGLSSGNTVITLNITTGVGTGSYINWQFFSTNAVGQDGGASYFINQSTVAGLGGKGGGYTVNSGLGGGYIGDGGGTGGQGSRAPNNPLSLSGATPYRVGGGSGGSTAGYTGNGGNAGTDGSGFNPANPRDIILPTAGAGGGAGGSWNKTPNNFASGSNPENFSFGAGSGGSGTGVNGEGASGGYWKSATQEYIMSGQALAYGVDEGAVGQPGSGGGPTITQQNYPGVGNGFGAVGIGTTNNQLGGNGGLYGAGGGSVGPQQFVDPASDKIGFGGNGAVRLIWGAGRSFPSTNTANV